jgi:hypothetical protein
MKPKIACKYCGHLTQETLVGDKRCDLGYEPLADRHGIKWRAAFYNGYIDRILKGE